MFEITTTINVDIKNKFVCKNIVSNNPEVHNVILESRIRKFEIEPYEIIIIILIDTYHLFIIMTQSR